jgi:hypothetical protein
MKWIDSNKELPNFDFEVLTCDKRGNVSTLWYRKNDNDYKYWGDWDDNEHENITHWMPLPLPPKSVCKGMFKRD